MIWKRGENLRAVPIGEMLASDNPADVLIAYGLGSCVAICLYDPISRVGGMMHALLPFQTYSLGEDGRPTKYVDRGFPLLLESMMRLGARKRRLRAYLFGGAKMAAMPSGVDILNVGERNVIAAREALHTIKLRPRVEEIGGDYGRTVKFYIGTGKITLKTLVAGERIVSVGT